VLAEQNLRSRQRNSIIRTNTFVHLDLVVFVPASPPGRRGAGAAVGQLCAQQLVGSYLQNYGQSAMPRPAFLSEPRKNSTSCERANRAETTWRMFFTKSG
jgi:hypothetical protein